MQIISAEDKINSLIEEGKTLKQRSLDINNIRPSEINEFYLQEGRNLMREIWNFVSWITYRENIVDRKAKKAEADQVRLDKVNKVQDIIIRSAKYTYWVEHQVRVNELNYIKSILLTELQLLKWWIELATIELGRQARIV